MEFTRRSGPGGQHRNKVETAVVLKHRPTGIIVEANERRSQSENREQAVRRLRMALALRVRAQASGTDVPSLLWKSRCVGGRVRVNPSHEDFAPLLAEALDVLWLEAGDVNRGAEKLGCTPSQLVKLLREEPEALSRLNVLRRENELRPLK